MVGAAFQGHAFNTFNPKPFKKRVVKEVQLRWEVREHLARYCVRSIGVRREQVRITPPVAVQFGTWRAKRASSSKGYKPRMWLRATKSDTASKSIPKTSIRQVTSQIDARR
jgi:hypothetical protein